MKYHPYPKVRRDSLSIKIILHRIDFYADGPYDRMMCHHDIRTEIQSYGARIYLQHAKVYHAPKPYALICTPARHAANDPIECAQTERMALVEHHKVVEKVIKSILREDA